MTDEAVTKFAQRYRAAAALVQTVRDENATPGYRVAAAEKRTAMPKPITVSDLTQMTDEQRYELLTVPLNHYLPNLAAAMLADACEEAVRLYEQAVDSNLPSGSAEM